MFRAGTVPVVSSHITRNMMKIKLALSISREKRHLRWAGQTRPRRRPSMKLRVAALSLHHARQCERIKTQTIELERKINVSSFLYWTEITQKNKCFSFVTLKNRCVSVRISAVYERTYPPSSFFFLVRSELLCWIKKTACKKLRKTGSCFAEYRLVFKSSSLQV